jgi:hypothetical protein
MRFSVSGRALLAALVVVVAATVGGIAYASIPDSGGVIHGCYSANGANGTNGTELNIINRDSASCSKGQQEITWGQTGRQGPAGKDGVSVTSASLDPGDANCPEGGSQFTAAGASITYACNGAKGDKGDTGPAGPSTAYTNYGSGIHRLAPFTTQTVASVTLPTGSYTLSATPFVINRDLDNSTYVTCSFLSAGTLNGNPVLLAPRDFVGQLSIPLIGDVTITTNTAPVFLRCSTTDDVADVGGDMIATRVGTITPSE